MAAGVIESQFADYLKAFTDQPAASLEDLIDSHGYQRQPFLKRLLPRQVCAKSLTFMGLMSDLCSKKCSKRRQIE